MENVAPRSAGAVIRRWGLAAGALSWIAGAAACSFAWEDYTPSADAAASSSGAGAAPAGSSASSSTATSSSGGASGPGGAGAGGGGGDGGGCGAAEKLCGGACVDVDDPAFGCTGAGCQPCVMPNADVSCAAGVCVQGECNPGFGDCSPLNPGCETSTTTDSQNCGGCNQPCPGTTCINGACSLENCTNNVDDDGDAMIDCADADCVTYSCAAVTQPWKGPVFLYDGAFATKPADCAAVPGTLEYVGFNGVSSNPAVCSACGCAQPEVTCQVGQLFGFAGSGCMNPLGGGAQPPPGTCAGAQPVGVVSVSADPPSASGACVASGGVPTLAPVAWQTAGVVCEPPSGGGCVGNAVCVGNAPSSFGATPCTFRGGDHACPAGFPDKHLFHDGANDTRACGACDCGAPAGSGTCVASTAVFPLAGCQGMAVGVLNDSSCVDVPAAASILVDTMVTMNDFADCPASGGMPLGGVTESSAVTTVCCAP